MSFDYNALGVGFQIDTFSDFCKLFGLFNKSPQTCRTFELFYQLKSDSLQRVAHVRE